MFVRKGLKSSSQKQENADTLRRWAEQAEGSEHADREHGETVKTAVWAEVELVLHDNNDNNKTFYYLKSAPTNMPISKVDYKKAPPIGKLWSHTVFAAVHLSVSLYVCLLAKLEKF